MFLKKVIFTATFFMFLQGMFAMERNQEGEWVDLTNPNVLRPLLAEEFQDEFHLSKALEIVKSIYEVNQRVIGTNFAEPAKYGCAFAMHPEIMAETMKKCKGKVVLEIAGASGENAILFAFAGAKHVYMNDIEPDEVKKFEGFKASLPPSVRNRLESLNCDIFEILQTKNLKSQIDFFYCRNFIHFLKDEQLKVFFQLLKQLSKPSGSDLIFTTNSAYNPPYSSIIIENPEATRFSVAHCYLYDYSYDNSGIPIAEIFRDASVCNEDSDPLSFQQLRVLYKINGKWSIEPDNNKLSKELRTKFDKEKKKPDLQKKFKSAMRAAVGVIINTMRCYTFDNLKILFETHGFEVEKTFGLSTTGHITTIDLSPFSVGIRAKYFPDSQNKNQLTLKDART